VAVEVRVGNLVGGGDGSGLTVDGEVAVGLLWVTAIVGTSGAGVVKDVSVGVCGSSSEQPAKISKIQEKRKIRFI
jgi:hypothetical protein